MEQSEEEHEGRIKQNMAECIRAKQLNQIMRMEDEGRGEEELEPLEKLFTLVKMA